MTPEERQSIIDEVRQSLIAEFKEEMQTVMVEFKKEIHASEERMMVILPDIFSNLVIDNKEQMSMVSKFYKDNPSFKGHENVVAPVVSEVDGKNPLLSYPEKLKKSVPEIKKRIEQMSGLDMKTIDSNPSRRFDKINPPRLGSNGKI